MLWADPPIIHQGGDRVPENWGGAGREYGAHEVMELHEVLQNSINSINLFNLFREHVRDSRLEQVLDRQTRFMESEYNTLVQAASQTGLSSGTPYRARGTTSPRYGLRQPAPQRPVTGDTIGDREVASGMLGAHKAGAGIRMHAALEFANPELRRMMVQGAQNCAEQAYECWEYMNEKGFYQVPTLQQNTTKTMLETYQPIGGAGNQFTAGYGTANFGQGGGGGGSILANLPNVQ